MPSQSNEINHIASRQFSADMSPNTEGVNAGLINRLLVILFVKARTHSSNPQPQVGPVCAGKSSAGDSYF
ncbi:hypothetical protein VDGE_30017 [Verticillium dahliae]|uniref:Uncharacterized protein n=1 Tax=Verticillium dahliae TaxID=27337 RepID=A0A444SAP1_VERDA|nr:hypothetical protein VDGE_30017 [Verticillium dahliae]